MRHILPHKQRSTSEGEYRKEAGAEHGQINDGLALKDAGASLLREGRRRQC